MNATISNYRMFLWTILLVKLVRKSADFKVFAILHHFYDDMMYLLIEIELTPGGSSTVHIYSQTIHIKGNETDYPERNIHNNNNTLDILVQN
jgi:hypothetical protein